MSGKHTEVPIDQSLIAIQEAINFHIFITVYEALYHTPHCCVQCLTVTAAR